MFVWTFLLRITHTIISQSSADSSWNTLYVYIQGSPVKIQIPAPWNLIGRSLTLLSSSSILPPPSHHCAFHSRKEKLGAPSKNITFFKCLKVWTCLFFRAQVVKKCVYWRIVVERCACICETVAGGKTSCMLCSCVRIELSCSSEFVWLILTLILRRSHTGTVWFYTSTSNKRAARPKLYTKSLTGDLKLMYSRLTLVRISIKL